MGAPAIRELAPSEVPEMRTAGRAMWRFGILATFAALVTSCEQVRITAVDVASLTVDPSEGTLAPGDTLRLRATLRDLSGNNLENRSIEWRSADPAIVRVEGEGLVRGMSPGTTTVRASSQGATGEASITVLTADEADRTPCTELDGLLADLRAIEDAHPGSDLADELEDVREEVEEAYFERCVKHPPDRKAAAKNLEDAVEDMWDVIDDGLIGTFQGVGLLDRLLWVSRTMAIEEIEAAEARGGRQRNIEKAEELVAEGDALHAKGEFEDAAEKYTDAISEAEKA
jgi:hypothetical protein